MNTLLLLAVLSGLELAVVHWLAMEFELYWRYWWLDIVVHVIGGAFVAFTVLAFLFRRAFPNPPMFAMAIFAALIVWEGFGVYVEKGLKPYFYSDTTIDLVSGAFGAALGYLVARAFRKISL